MLGRHTSEKLELVLLSTPLLFNERGGPLDGAQVMIDKAGQYADRVMVYPRLPLSPELQGRRLRRKIRAIGEECTAASEDDLARSHSRIVKELKVSPANVALVENRRAGLVAGYWNDLGYLVALNCNEDVFRVPTNVLRAKTIYDLPGVLAGIVDERAAKLSAPTVDMVPSLLHR